MASLVALLDAKESLKRAVAAVIGQHKAFVETTTKTDLFAVSVRKSDLLEPRELVAAVAMWLASVPRSGYRVLLQFRHPEEEAFDASSITLGHGPSAVAVAAPCGRLGAEDVFGNAARALGLPTVLGRALGLPDLTDAALLPRRAFRESGVPFEWSFEDVRAACLAQAARPLVEAWLGGGGGLPSDAVMALAAPALPRARSLEREARLRRAPLPPPDREGPPPRPEDPRRAPMPPSSSAAELDLAVSRRREESLAVPHSRADVGGWLDAGMLDAGTRGNPET